MSIPWTDTVTALVAVAAFVISCVSLALSYFGIRLAYKQDERRKPNLLLKVEEGIAYKQNRTNCYAFRLIISNRTDADNSIAEIKLKIMYQPKLDQSDITLKVPSSLKKPSQFTHENTLIVPLCVKARGVAVGWSYFEVDKAALEGVYIESYAISIRDVHGNEFSKEAIIIRDESHELQQR